MRDSGQYGTRNYLKNGAKLNLQNFVVKNINEKGLQLKKFIENYDKQDVT